MSIKDLREQAVAALNDPDWSDAEVDRDVRPARVVYSARIPAHLTDRLVVEANRRGVTPSRLIADLVEEALTGREDQEVTVRLSDLHRAIDSAVHRAA